MTYHRNDRGFVESSLFWKQLTSRNSTTEYQRPLDPALKNKVQLQVYYETLCPASVNFLVTQLKPTVKRLGAHLEVRLIPYGHAKTYIVRRRYVFECQHGPRECFGNIVHACAIHALQNNTKAVLFNSCLMRSISYQSDHHHFAAVLRWCGYKENVNVSEIWKCANSSRGRHLLKKYGEVTQALNPAYVPYIMLNGFVKYEDEAAVNLFGVVCQILNPKPLACQNSRQHVLRKMYQ